MWVVVPDNIRRRLHKVDRVAVVDTPFGSTVVEIDENNEEIGDPIFTADNKWVIHEALKEAGLRKD